MNRKLLLLLILVAAVVAPIGYFSLVLSCVKENAESLSSLTSTKVFIETMALLIYTSLGIRFFNRHVNFFR